MNKQVEEDGITREILDKLLMIADNNDLKYSPSFKKDKTINYYGHFWTRNGKNFLGYSITLDLQRFYELCIDLKLI